MRRLLVGLVLATLAALGAAPSASAQAPTMDAVTGSISLGIGFGRLFGDVDAHSGPSGEAASGTVTVGSGLEGRFTLSVVCLTVGGNRASLLASAPSPVPGFPPIAVQLAVEDNGLEQEPLDLDLFNFPLRSGTVGRAIPTTCPLPTGSLPPADPFRFAQVTVVDAQPLPTSKEQCKNGGWRNFPGFKNQGDCVSFVATGGKNPPAGP